MIEQQHFIIVIYRTYRRNSSNSVINKESRNIVKREGREEGEMEKEREARDARQDTLVQLIRQGP